MTTSTLEQYGYSDRFKAFSCEYPQLVPARIISREKGIYRIITDEGEFLAELSGKFVYNAAYSSDYPAVGDYVMTDKPRPGSNAVIKAILPRNSVFIRKAAGKTLTDQVVAANIDLLFICMSLNNDYNLRRLERYLSVAWDSNASAVVVLTKADLCENLSEKLEEVRNIAIANDVISVSSATETGYDEIKKYLKPGKTAALIGSSGVGKSTIVNYLLGEDRFKVNALRNDDRGRHTTTRRELILLESGALLIDTPGMRELGIWDSSEGTQKTFADIEELSAHCRFKDCTHTNEPGCAVLDAIARGAISDERLESYKKLSCEGGYYDDKESYLARKKEKFKQIAKQNKNKYGK